MSDIVERLRANKVLNVCPFDKLSPEYYTTPNDKPCKFCGGEPEGPDKCTGADLRIMGEAADEITSLRTRISDLERELADARDKALEESRDATCRGCQKGDPINESGYHCGGVGYTYPCHAAAIQALRTTPTQSTDSGEKDG